MNHLHFLWTYIRAWSEGDAQRACGLLDESFILRDPDYGNFPKTRFVEYFGLVCEAIGRLGGNRPGRPLLEVSDVVTRQENGTMTGWAHWIFPGTTVEGASLFKVGPKGSLSAQLFNKAPFRRP